MSKNYLESFLHENGLDKGEFFTIYNASKLPVGYCVDTVVVYRYDPVEKELRAYKSPECKYYELAYPKTIVEILRGERILYKISDIIYDATPPRIYSKDSCFEDKNKKKWRVRKDVSLCSSDSNECELNKGNICEFNNYEEAKKKFDEM